MISPATSQRRPYIRSMNGWWHRNDFYLEYMIHESTALFVAAYALVLLVGLIRLAEGSVAWDGWVQALRSPLSIGFHVVMLLALSYHAWTWFHIMPRTLPPIMVAGKRLTANAIIFAGLIATVVASLIVFGLTWSAWT